jgi:polyisoprenoid-binding protein YceI
MKSSLLLSSLLAATITVALSARAADTLTRFDARSGGKIRIEGTSNIHDWQVESGLIGGFMEVGAGFPIEPGQTAAPGKVEAKATVNIPVRALTSIEKDGKPYSTAMDDIMHEKLRMADSPKIVYTLTELALKEAPKTKDNPYVYDAKGSLVVAGVTNAVSMPVSILPLGDKKLKITGTVSVKMTDYKIDPPAPKIALGFIKTGDDVKLIFEWLVAQKKAQ